MLYATTRNKVSTYTARRALKEERAPDGGLFVPTQFPRYDRDSLDELLRQPGPDIVAQILNRFFKTKITGMEVSFVLGDRFYGTAQLGHRIFVGELWRNEEGGLDSVSRKLASLICAEMGVHQPGMWMRIATRMALIFAVFGELHRSGLDAEPMDVAVMTGNFEGPYAVWAARKMGLNIGAIICCGNENSPAWELFHRGQLRMNPEFRRTLTPDCNSVVPEALELYCYSVLDWDDGTRFEDLLNSEGIYCFSAEEQHRLAAGFAAVVVGEERVLRAIPNLYSSFGYIACPYSALVYAGVEDYRGRPGRGRGTLMLTERDPRAYAALVTKALDIDSGALRDWCLNG